MLERLAAADAGAWVLAKVDVDANPQLSAAAQVQSIPTVMVVWQGQVIPGFIGALPEAQVRDFLDQVIALTGNAGGPGSPAAEAAAPEDPELLAADEALAGTTSRRPRPPTAQILATRPDHPDARQGLASLTLLQAHRRGSTSPAREPRPRAPTMSPRTRSPPTSSCWTDR